MKLLALCLLAFCATPCFGDCRSTTIAGSLGTFEVTPSEFDTTWSSGVPGSPDFHQACVQFDLTKGSLETCLDGPGDNLTTTIYDQFVLHGTPSGVAAILRLLFTLHSVDGSNSGLYTVGLCDPNQPGVPCQITGGSLQGIVFEADFIVMPEEILPLTISLSCTNRGSPIQSAGGTWSFSGLQKDSWVTSCHGYLQGNAPVAVTPTSWGELKARYR